MKPLEISNDFSSANQRSMYPHDTVRVKMSVPYDASTLLRERTRYSVSSSISTCAASISTFLRLALPPSTSKSGGVSASLVCANDPVVDCDLR